MAAPSLATTGSVVISEINYQSSPQFDPGDWFEVVNTEDFPLSLAGWSVRDSNQENLTTLGDLVIQPGEGMVFAADSFLFTGAFSTIPPPNQVLNFNLSANGDRIALFDPVSRMKDEVEYVSAPPWPDASGTDQPLYSPTSRKTTRTRCSGLPGPLEELPSAMGTGTRTGPGSVPWGYRSVVPCPHRGTLPSSFRHIFGGG